MWMKLAGGAVAGVLLGSFLSPGLAFWVVLGIVAGYVLHAWSEKRRRAAAG